MPNTPDIAEARPHALLASTRVRVAAVAIILLLALGLRVMHALDSGGLWRDEAQGMFLVDESADLGELYENLLVEGHPPLAYTIQKLVGDRFGHTPGVVRALSVAYGFAAVVVIMLLAWRTFGARTGLLSGFLMAISPYFVNYSTEIRAYPLMTLLGAVHAFAYVRFLDKRCFATAAVWGASAALMAYCHYFAFFIILAAGICALATAPTRRNFLRVVVGGAAFVLVFGPWLPSFLQQAGSDLQPWYVPKRSPKWIFEVLAAAFSPWGLAFAGIGVVLGILDRRVFRDAGNPEVRRRWIAFFGLLSLSLGAAFLAWFAQLHAGAFKIRYLVAMAAVAIPALCYPWCRLLAGDFRFDFLAPRVQRGIALAMIAVVVVGQASDPDRWKRPRSPAAKIAAIVEREARPGDLVWIFPSAFASCFNYHYTGDLKQIAAPYRGRFTRTDWVDVVAKINDPDHVDSLIVDLEAHLRGGGRVWLVADGFLHFEPHWAFFEAISPPEFGKAHLLHSEYQVHRRVMKSLYRFGLDQAWWDWSDAAYQEAMTLVLFRQRGAHEPLAMSMLGARKAKQND
ncbi:MAG: glycosyltransferase family 39 protein [Planctomycetota bacterium]